jgi:hypothetical protein
MTASSGTFPLRPETGIAGRNIDPIKVIKTPPESKCYFQNLAAVIYSGQPEIFYLFLPLHY